LLRGTRIITGQEARRFTHVIDTLSGHLDAAGIERVIVPSIWEAATFEHKVGPENTKMMWTFADKSDRRCCLIPEVTGLLQETWRNEWAKASRERPVFYVQRCYRYERPQRGRYREHTQVGIELLGSADVDAAKHLLRDCLDLLGVTYDFHDDVIRGASYYTRKGFEARVEGLGAQRQIAGGGAYAEGVGWGIGVDRVAMALAVDVDREQPGGDTQASGGDQAPPGAGQ
jgi:histidyl-tRNA synthetase